jgi:hypothetical protein
MSRDKNKASKLIDETQESTLPSSALKANETENATILVNIRKKVTSEHYNFPVNKVTAWIKEKDANKEEVYELKYCEGKDYSYYKGVYPICSNTVAEDLAQVAGNISKWFGSSAIDLENELFQLQKRLRELEDEKDALFRNMEILTKEWKECNKKISEVTKKIAEKEVEYKNRTEERKGKTLFVCVSAQVKGSLGLIKTYTADIETVNTNDCFIPSFDIYIDVENPYLSDIYLDPANPLSDASGNGTYRLYFKVYNILAGTEVKVHLTGSDGYTQDGERYFSYQQEPTKLFMEIPVALELGVKDVIEIRLSHNNKVVDFKLISTVFR